MASNVSEEELALLEFIKQEIGETQKGQSPQEYMKKYLKPGSRVEHETQRREYIPVSKREPPRISNFSGYGSKNETSYELWIYEVNSLISDKVYDQDSINYAVRHSLRGEAGRVAMHLGPKATVEEIISKLDSIYGEVGCKEDIMAEFYRSRQRDDESVTAWSCRLEDIIGKAVTKKLVFEREKNTMLKSMLWNGLKTSLKDISGHKYDTIDNFDELRIALRQIEKDHEERKSQSRKPNPSKAISTKTQNTQEQSDINEVKDLVKQMSLRMDRWENRGRDRYRGPTNTRGRGYRDNVYGRTYNRDNVYGRTYNRDTYTDDQQRPSGQDQQRSRWQDRSRTQPPTTASGNNTKYSQEIRCYRCGQVGHVRKGCRVKMEDLNTNKPVKRGRR